MNVRPQQRSRCAKPLTTIPQTSARFGHEGTRKPANNQTRKKEEKAVCIIGGGPGH